nr:uncharacterized mitochondrial protein AtMg00810-like [Tanacetum cinerariifolium]
MMGKISFFLGLQISQSPRGIFINQSKYALESLKKYSFESCDPVDTPMVEKSKLDEDREGKAVDLSHYHGMIGTLLYLTASRPDLQFAICMCARYQARPTKKYVHAVKRIFQYLCGTVHRGLWYPKDSSVALTAFADADHAGCQDTRRSTSESVQFLGERLISWSSKRQKSASISNTEAEYIALSEYQLADLFTKALGRGRTEFLINKLGMRSFTPETLKQLMNEEDETMATTIEQQVEMDEALVPNTQRLRIGRSNLRLPSDIQFKESTLQLVYDVLRRCPFFKAFPVSADVPEIYMQEFWATAYVHQQSIQFKINNKKLIVSLESFREMLHICPRIHGQSFDELPFEEKILDFIRDDSIFLTIKVVSRHQTTQQYGAMLPIELTNDEIRNTKAYKEYYAFATTEVVPKPKSSAKNKRSNSDTSITPPATTTPKPTVAVTSRLTAIAKGKQTTKSLPAPLEVARTVAQQLKIVFRRSRQQMHISQPGGSGTDEGTSLKPGVSDVPTDESEEELSWNSSDDEGADDQVKDRDDDEGDEGDESDEGEEDTDEDKVGDERNDDEENQETAKYDEQDDAEGGGDDEEEGESDEEDDNKETREEESFDPIPKTPEGSKDEGDGEEDQGLNVNEEEHVEEEEEDELYKDVNINQGRGLQATLEVEDTHVTLTLINSDGMESIFMTASSSMAPLHTSTPIMTPSTIATITTISQAPIPPTPIPSEKTNSFAEAVSNISSIVHQYMNQHMTEAVGVAVQIQTNRLCDSYQRENDEFLRTIDENMKRIIKEQVKGQVKEQDSRILPRIEQSVNAQLEAEVLNRSSHSSRTSYAVAADLSEMELKKILIEKMEGNKSIQRSDEQRNLYKALVDAYEADNIILDSYGETVILKRRHDDDD